MNASEYIKAQGLPSLQYVSEVSTVSRSTLGNWWREDRVKFETMVAGVVLKHMQDQQETSITITGYGIEVR